MQIIKTLMNLLIILGLIKPAFAAPPFQILRTCMDGKAYNEKVAVLILDDAGSADNPVDGCEEQSDFKFNGQTYGTLTSKDKFYLIINGKKVDPEQVENMSVNPEIKPGVEFTSRAIWYKIDFEKKEYLCILAPLAEQGIGASYSQYYISENAFDQKLNPNLYFYFLEKNIAPVNSKTL